MQITKRFDRTFSFTVIESAVEKWKALNDIPGDLTQHGLEITVSDDESRRYDTFKDWLIAFQRPHIGAQITFRADYLIPYNLDHAFTYDEHRGGSTLNVNHQREDLAELLIEVFRSAEPPEPLRVFIGHGGSDTWRKLQHHLSDEHGYTVTAFETGSTAGRTARDVLNDALRNSSFAVLVLSAEDEQADGQIRARQNVVHEVGLFQGRLGWELAIVVAETGIELFSNEAGVQRVDFPSGHIEAAFGSVLGAIRREFGDRR